MESPGRKAFTSRALEMTQISVQTPPSFTEVLSGRSESALAIPIEAKVGFSKNLPLDAKCCSSSTKEWPSVPLMGGNLFSDLLDNCLSFYSPQGAVDKTLLHIDYNKQ